MACHEIAALRLGLMQVLGRTTRPSASTSWPSWATAPRPPAPSARCARRHDLASLQSFFAGALSRALAPRWRARAPTTRKLPYYRDAGGADQEGRAGARQPGRRLTRLYRDLDEMHDFVHEMYPTRRGVGEATWPLLASPPSARSSRSAATRACSTLTAAPSRSAFAAASTSSSTPAWSPPTGKAVKRAYSLLSADSDQQRFILASKRMPDGPGSGYMHALAPGDAVKFSGPWGKLRPAEGRVGPDAGAGHRHRHHRRPGAAVRAGASRRCCRTRGFIWLRTDPTYFLPDDARAGLPAAPAGARSRSGCCRRSAIPSASPTCGRWCADHAARRLRRPSSPATAPSTTPCSTTSSPPACPPPATTSRASSTCPRRRPTRRRRHDRRCDETRPPRPKSASACAPASPPAPARRRRPRRPPAALVTGTLLTEIETTLPNRMQVTFPLQRCERVGDDGGGQRDQGRRRRSRLHPRRRAGRHRRS